MERIRDDVAKPLGDDAGAAEQDVPQSEPQQEQLASEDDGVSRDDGSLVPGDVFVTKHSNLSQVHVVFHVVVDDGLATMPLNPRAPVISGIRNVLSLAAKHDVTNVMIPLLLAPPRRGADVSAYSKLQPHMTKTWCVKRAELVLKCVKGEYRCLLLHPSSSILLRLCLYQRDDAHLPCRVTRMRCIALGLSCPAAPMQAF